MAILSHGEAQQDDLDHKEFEALDEELVSPRDVVDSENASNHANEFHEEQVDETSQVQRCEEFVWLVPGCLEAAVKLGVEQPVDFETEDKA